MAHPHHDLLTGLDEAFNAGDFDAVLSFLADDFTIHIAGRSKMAGDHTGKEMFAGLIGQYIEALGPDPEMETHAILADDEHGIMLQRVRATKQGHSADIRTVNIFHFDDGKISEMWSWDEDPYLADAFYDS